MAAIVGRPFGRRTYTILGSTRSLEGSTAMLVAGWLATFVALLLLAPIPPATAAVVALVTTIGATAAEAVSPWGTDNLTVPAVSVLILVLMLPS
jgi:phytol kinase